MHQHQHARIAFRYEAGVPKNKALDSSYKSRRIEGVGRGRHTVTMIRKTSFNVDFEKLLTAGAILGVPQRGDQPSPTAVVDAALDEIIGRESRRRALEIMGNPELVDLEAGRNGWR